MHLIIGGTKFLGRHLVDSLLARGHEVTLFNRGKHPAENMPEVETIRGDRTRDLDLLKGRKWESVIDTCGYLPQTVTAAAEALADAAERYVFISSISAYADFSQPGFDETTPLIEMSDDQRQRAAAIDPNGDITAVVLGDLYGGLKAQCERAALAAMPGRVLTIRPGLIVGPYDPTDRFTYWVMRTARGGKVFAPGDPDRFVQFIYARDLADWIVAMIEGRANGAYTANGKQNDITMGQMLEQTKAATGSDAEFTWAPEEFLAREEVRPWGQMPLFMPESATDYRGFLSANVDRALQSGLKLRSMSETILDTYRWRSKTYPEIPLQAGITAEREIELLAKLKSH
jgi:2'-hydroxyisoflavone reductase